MLGDFKPDCAKCGGRGHYSRTPEDLGWKRIADECFAYQMPDGTRTLLSVPVILTLCDCQRAAA